MSSPDGSGPELRIDDAEREAAVAALGEHYAAGRLTKDEFDDRSAQAYAARTRSALWPLFADLPRPEPERPLGPARGGSGYGRPGGGRPDWRPGLGLLPLLPVLLVALVVSALVGHPVVLVVLLVIVLMRIARRHHHYSGRR